jgi:hypothetical protein
VQTEKTGGPSFPGIDHECLEILALEVCATNNSLGKAEAKKIGWSLVVEPDNLHRELSLHHYAHMSDGTWRTSSTSLYPGGSGGGDTAQSRP